MTAARNEPRPPPSYPAFRGLILFLLGGLIIAGLVIVVRSGLWREVLPGGFGLWRWFQRRLLPW